MQPRVPDRDPIRVLLGPMPELLREMIEDLLSIETDMVVLGQSDDPATALANTCSAHADMLIMQAQKDEGTGILEAIVQAPPFSILAISAAGTDATAVRLIHENVLFDTSSGAAFAAAIRRVARTSVSKHAPGEARWLG